MTKQNLRIGFYAPMKSPNHAVASGDRRMAGGLVKALTSAGADVQIVSELRSYLGNEGDAGLENLQMQADAELARLRELYKKGEGGEGWDLLFCYHLYHKAPDLLLPRLADDLGVPYIVAEASYAKKLRGSHYNRALSLSAEAILRADLILQLNGDDYQGLVDLHAEHGAQACIVPMVPFSDFADGGVASIEADFGEDCIFIVHAMMRYGDKYNSYRLLAEAFKVLSGLLGWRLVIIGGGEAEADIRLLFADFGERVYFAGILGDDAIRGWLDLADIYVWGGINEAYGMGVLEAVMMGLPVIVGDRLGVRGIVGDGGGILCLEGDVDIFSGAVHKLYNDYMGGRELLERMGDYNRGRGELHSLEGAGKFLMGEIGKCMNNANGQKQRKKSRLQDKKRFA